MNKCWFYNKDDPKSCQNPMVDEDHPDYPFCGSACHEKYANERPVAKNIDGKPRRTIEQCQARIQEIIAEKRREREIARGPKQLHITS